VRRHDAGQDHDHSGQPAGQDEARGPDRQERATAGVGAHPDGRPGGVDATAPGGDHREHQYAQQQRGTDQQRRPVGRVGPEPQVDVAADAGR